ncbi:MAG: SH3 domain-containing protein [Candidatus Aminicenantes bacterium]|nr:SH3 domain-containing protein [Candidatus Aminicenantes bacterium]
MKSTKALTVFLILSLLILCVPGKSWARKLKIKVVVDNTKVYFEPDLAGNVITNVPAGEVYEVQKRTGDFYEVNLPPDEHGFMVSGYIHKSAVEELESEDVKEKTEEETSPPAPRKITKPPQPPSPAGKVITAPPPPERRPEPVAYESRGGKGVEIGFRLFGDFLFTMGTNDFNAFAEGMSERLESISVPPWCSVTNNWGLMKQGYGGGGEFYVNILPYLGLAFGAGYIQQKAETEFEVRDNLFMTSEGMQLFTKVAAVPLTFSLYFNIPAGRIMKFSLYGGLGLYLSNVEWNSISSFKSSTSWADSEQTWNAKSNPLGFHGGLNLEFDIAGAFAFIIGFNGRVVKFTDLTADMIETLKSSTSPLVKNIYPNATLWYCETQLSGKWYSSISISGTPPSGTGFRNVRKAEISLGGIALVAGFKIRIK